MKLYFSILKNYDDTLGKEEKNQRGYFLPLPSTDKIPFA